MWQGWSAPRVVRRARPIRFARVRARAAPSDAERCRHWFLPKAGAPFSVRQPPPDASSTGAGGGVARPDGMAAVLALDRCPLSVVAIRSQRSMGPHVGACPHPCPNPPPDPALNATQGTPNTHPQIVYSALGLDKAGPAEPIGQRDNCVHSAKDPPHSPGGWGSLRRRG